jgi:hypothetical protein
MAFRYAATPLSRGVLGSGFSGVNSGHTGVLIFAISLWYAKGSSEKSAPERASPSSLLAKIDKIEKGDKKESGGKGRWGSMTGFPGAASGDYGENPFEAAKAAGIGFSEVIIDSTTMKVRRHGGGQKGGYRPKWCRGRG